MMFDNNTSNEEKYNMVSHEDMPNTSEIHIQYDKRAGTFVLPEKENSEQNNLVVSKLNENLTQVRSWLSVKRGNGKFSHCFIAELATNSLSRYFHIHAIYDEIGILERTDPRPSMTKKARQMQGSLRGLWHKHYFDPHFMVRNMTLEVEKMMGDGRWEKIFSPHYGKYIHEIANEISHEMTIGAFQKRAHDHRVTGEFIVYEPQEDGSNYYITLGRHGEWDQIEKRVKEYKLFDGE